MTTFSLPDGAALLTELADARYLRVDWVMRQESGGRPEYYCPAAAWSTTPAGQLAAKDAAIAALQTRVAELESQLAARPVPPAVAAGGTGLSDAPLETCGIDGCTVQKPAGQSIKMHRWRKHVYQHPAAVDQAVDQAAPPLPILADGAGWICADCGTDTHTPSLTQPDRCVRCALRPASNGNGVHA